MIMSAVCLLIGVVLGYLLRGSAPLAPSSGAMTATARTPAGAGSSAGPVTTQDSAPGSHPQLALDNMRHMTNLKAAPLLEKLKADPRDANAWNQLGILYRATHQFKEAESYFEKSLEIDPKNVDARVDLASCLYYNANVDGALAQLNEALTYNPKHPGALMNLGIILLKGKNDAPGAIAVWQKLLQLNPDFAQKDAVERMIAEAQQSY